MNKLKTKYNVLAQSKLESSVLSTALLAIYLTLWVSLNHNKTEDAENPLKSRQQFKTK
jgi:hypothetical protein